VECVPHTLDVDELLLGQRPAIDRVSSVLSDVLLDQTPLEHLVGDRRHTGVLRHLVGDWNENNICIYNYPTPFYRVLV